MKGRQSIVCGWWRNENDDNVGIVRFPDLPFLSALTPTPSQASLVNGTSRRGTALSAAVHCCCRTDRLRFLSSASLLQHPAHRLSVLQLREAWAGQHAWHERNVFPAFPHGVPVGRALLVSLRWFSLLRLLVRANEPGALGERGGKAPSALPRLRLRARGGSVSSQGHGRDEGRGPRLPR